MIEDLELEQAVLIKKISDKVINIIKGNGLSEELSIKITNELIDPFISVFRILKFNLDLLDTVIGKTNLPDQSLSEYYGGFYLTLFEKSNESVEFEILEEVANYALTIKKRIEKNKTSIYNDFFDESSMIDEELDIGELAAGKLLINIVANGTKTILDDIQMNLSTLKAESIKDSIEQLKTVVKPRPFVS